ncbi:MAG TPA: LysR substrate-binding domain-containing protein [Variovorax sp.]|nr:LysR substrate-binding domain-containing protein [Variovorax sp.]
MEFRQLKYFLDIVESKGLSRAAEHLHVAQSALSRQVAELEGELGVKLLLRSRNGVTTTEAGKVFYEYARGILKQIADAREAVLRSSDTVVGSVVVALPQSVAATLALPLMRAAASRYPSVLFHLNEELTGNMADQLLGGRVDMAIFTETMPSRDIAFVPLVKEAFVLMHAPHDAHAPAAGDISIEEATARPLVLPSPQHGHCTRWVVDDALKLIGHPPQRVAAEINSVYVLKSAVEAGIGPSIMPLGLAQREVEEGRLIAHRIVSPDVSRTLGLCTSRHLPETNARRALCKLIKDVVHHLCESGQWAGASLVPPDGRGGPG